MLKKLWNLLTTPSEPVLHPSWHLAQYLSTQYSLNPACISLSTDTYPKKYVYINEYTEPLKVGYGANATGNTYVVLNNPDNLTTRYYDAGGRNKILSDPGHDHAFLLYKPLESFKLTVHDILNLPLPPEFLIIAANAMLHVLAREKEEIDSKFYKDEKSVIFARSIGLVKARIAPLRASHPELFI